MSMHLVGPWLSTTNTKKRKNIKFKSAEHKRRYYEQQAEWEKLKQKYKVETDSSRSKSTQPLKGNYKLTVPPDRDTKRIPSLSDTGFTGGVCAKPAPKVYTGTKLIGIATMHKSNMVPIFSNQEAEDVSKMRRG